ncbi:MAG TPA: hypothetical protein PLU23_02395 [Anaerolineaceae bacterium]|jgi:predicted PurR-regulated permease PerM|nr:hypothetical protein [Anaerolineaceae bacterium]
MDENTELKVETLHLEAQERQKKQRFRQIILPIIVTAVLLLVVLVVAILLAIKDPTGAGYKAGQITLIIVLFLALLIGLLLIWVLVKAIDGLYKLNRELPKYGKIALGGVVKVEEGTRKVADGTVEPLLQVQEIGTKVKQVGKSLKDRMSPEG